MNNNAATARLVPPVDSGREFAVSVARPAKKCTSQELLAGASELLIEHAGQEYRLRLTSQGKLILTK